MALTPTQAANPERTSGSGLRLLTIEELMQLPAGEWLIDEIIPKGALGVLYGQPGVGKSFLALDWALSIATKKEWQGHELKEGPVVYVASEGHSGLRQRVRAWMNHQDVEAIDKAFVMLHPAQLRDRGEVDGLLTQIAGRNLKPSLIVFDTLAGCFVGGEENSAKDMGELLAGVRRIQEVTGSAVLLVHHTDKKGEAERGSSALRGAADVMMLVSGAARRLRLENTKQKEAEPFKQKGFALHSVGVGTDARGKDLTSAVVVAGDEHGFDDSSPRLNPKEMSALLALYDAPDALTPSEWCEQTAKRHGKSVPRDTFDKWKKHLVQKGMCRKREDGRYELTDVGHGTAIGAPVKRHEAA